MLLFQHFVQYIFVEVSTQKMILQFLSEDLSQNEEDSCIIRTFAEVTV